MERNNGRDVELEERPHSGGPRLKSKVPRARFAPRIQGEFAPKDAPCGGECRPNGTGDKGHLVSLPGVAPAPPPAGGQQGDTDETKEWRKLLGERVCISGVKQGILRYYGRTNFAQGQWCGVELDEPVGKNNGTVSGVVYFRCRPEHGIFAPVSKVSKLNDLSGSDWHEDLQRGHDAAMHHTHNMDYNVRYSASDELCHDRTFIRTSRSDPTFLTNKVRTVLPHTTSESFPYDDSSSIAELRSTATAALPPKHKSKHSSTTTSYETSTHHRERSTFSAGEVRTNITSNPLTACLMSKFGYGAKSQFLGSKVARMSSSAEDHHHYQEVNGSVRGSVRQSEFLQRTSSNRAQPCPSHQSSIPPSSSFTAAKEEYENYFMKSSKSSGPEGPLSSEAKHYSGMQFMEEYRLSSDKLNSTYLTSDYPQEEEEFLLVDDDDQMSMDCDESLGILTPNQMKDFTLLGETPQGTTCSDIQGVNFPSSESFDDINELPEDEQVHVSVHYLPDTAGATARLLDISKQNAFQKSKVNGLDCDERHHHPVVSSTDKFLVSISSKDYSDYDVETRFSPAKLKLVSDAPVYGVDPDMQNNFPMADVLKSNLTADLEKELASKFPLESKDFISSNSDEVYAKPNLPGFIVPASENTESESEFHGLSTLLQIAKATETLETIESCVVTNYETQNLSDNKKLKLITKGSGLVEKPRNGYCDNDSSRDSLLQVDPEHTVSKEKLTVSWEDCVAQGSDLAFGSVERPDSVYTVASSDTGYQEEEYGESDGGDVVMATSIDSTEDSKRFSCASRDSCIVTEEADCYKIAESNSTSGYSTGLSDSCCNDRHDDDSGSCKPLTDESIQDSVGPCDSEDAFSLHDSIGVMKETVVETSDVTDMETALFVDSTSDALCETMVEDSTLTEIHELLMSPDDNLSSLNNPKDVEMEVNSSEAKDHNSTFVIEKIAPVVSPPPTCKSSPEKKLPNNNRSKALTARTTEPQRNQKPASLQAKNAANKSKVTTTTPTQEDVSKKQLVKSPKKNVISKIKAMIEATSCKTANATKSSSPDTVEVSPSKRNVSVPKKSRWESVTSKIAASLAEEKTKPKVKRDIKSKVDTNLMLARQQVTCKSPRQDSPRMSIREGSMSPTSVSSRDKRALVARNSAPGSVREDRSKDTTDSPKSPRPGKASSRSTSPVAPSESSTNSVSLNSHNSRSKIAQWKGSTSTVGSAAVATAVAPVAAPAKKAAPVTAPRFKPPLQTTKTVPPSRMVTKKTSAPTIKRSLLTLPNNSSGSRLRSVSPSSVTKVEPSRVHQQSKQAVKEHGATTRGAGAHHPSPRPARPAMWLSKAELSQEIQHLGNLCEARTKELNRLKMETKHITVGFDAFAALFKYMVEDLKALSVPKLVEDLEKTLKQLELTKQDLAYYEKEVEELKAHHCQELTQLSDKLFAAYQAQVAELNSKRDEEVNNLKTDHQKQVENMSTTYTMSSEDIKIQHEKLITSLEQELVKQREELQMFQDSEIKDLEEKHEAGTKALQSHIEQLQKKYAELKQHSMSMEDAMQKDTDTKLQWVASCKMDLQKEVESLKAVLEMKNKELHSLRVQNLEMDKQLEELPLAREKIKMLQARAEDLEALMEAKTVHERKLSSENHYIRETYEKESKVNRRLSMENEELQWRLRKAEHSLISDSLHEVSDQLEEDDVTTPPPHSVSRSVFFTFVDKDDNNTPQSPGSQYKKINRTFSVNYKTSPKTTPFKSHSSTTSPRKTKSHSEPPPPPPDAMPRRLFKPPQAKTKLHQKRQRCESDQGPIQGTMAEPVFESMASSASSEGSVFEHKEGLLEEHEDQIMVSLDILREQRSVEEAMDETETPCDATDKGWRVVDEAIRDGSSQSGDFTDPKTYYHMTFAVPRDPGGPDCDTEGNSKDSSNDSSPDRELLADVKHSILEGEVPVVNSEVSTNGVFVPEESVALCQSPVEGSRSGCSQGVRACTSTPRIDSAVQQECQGQNRWHTM